MEDYGVLDIDNDVHLFCLHYVFKPRIQEDLSTWQAGHNNHGVRTEAYQTPLNLWYSGNLANQHTNYSAMANIFRETGEERQQKFRLFEANHNWREPTNIGQVLSRIPAPLSPVELHTLTDTINVRAHSESNGVDIYGKVVEYVTTCNRQ